MSSKKAIRALLLGSAAGLVLAGAAQAAEFQFGEVQVFFDTTVSAGVSVRTADTRARFLPEGNGGPVDPRIVGAPIPAPLSTTANPLAPLGLGAGQLALINAGFGTALAVSPIGTVTVGAGLPDNFDGSINTDDGRLNFGSGDLTGATLKATHDLQVNWQNFTLFARATGFYDAVLDSETAGARSAFTEHATEIVGRNYELLDLFVSGQFDLGEFPLNLRLGKQVISWGEGTFILNGINVVNPVDVSAFRRPGAEIREGLVPVNAIYGSLGLDALIPNLSLEAFYQLDFQPVRVDPAGTPFASADFVTLGSGRGGNEFGDTFLSGSLSPNYGRRNCVVAAGGNITTALQNIGYLPTRTGTPANSVLNCNSSPFINYNTNYPVGRSELTRFDIQRLNPATNTDAQFGIIARANTLYASDDGQWGVALRYLAEDLGNTEFGFFAMNYHSRLPILYLEARRPELMMSVTSDSTDTTRGLQPGGCGGALDPRFLALGGFTNPFGVGLGTALPFAASTSWLGVFQANCNTAGGGVAILQSVFTPGAPAAPVLINGAETYAVTSNSRIGVEYPEDIQMFGFSFNTTLFGWGFQGEFSYRPDAPFQQDTDALTIASGLTQCTGLAAAGNLSQLLEVSATPVPGAGCTPAIYNTFLAPGGSYRLRGYIENEMYTAQIGTTATFTGSDPVIEWTGAQGGVLVTEFGAVYVPGVEDTWLTNLPNTGLGPLNPLNLQQPGNNPRWIQYQNTGCQGTDLPLGGILGLDFKPSGSCRPTDWSFGYVMLIRLDYNNAFNSGWTLQPQITFSHDIYGKTPSPYGNYLEDRMALSFGLTGTLNQNLQMRASYTNFFNGPIDNKAVDQDFASFSISYSF